MARRSAAAEIKSDARRTGQKRRFATLRLSRRWCSARTPRHAAVTDAPRRNNTAPDSHSPKDMYRRFRTLAYFHGIFFTASFPEAGAGVLTWECSLVVCCVVLCVCARKAADPRRKVGTEHGRRGRRSVSHATSGARGQRRAEESTDSTTCSRWAPCGVRLESHRPTVIRLRYHAKARDIVTRRNESASILRRATCRRRGLDQDRANRRRACDHKDDTNNSTSAA